MKRYSENKVQLNRPLVILRGFACSFHCAQVSRRGRDHGRGCRNRFQVYVGIAEPRKCEWGIRFRGRTFYMAAREIHTQMQQTDIQMRIQINSCKTDKSKPAATSMTHPFARELKCIHEMTFCMLWALSIGGKVTARERESETALSPCASSLN